RTTPGPPANSPAAVDSHRSRAAARCAPAPALRLSAIPPDASLSAPIWPPFGGPIKGTFLSRTKGDTISEAQQPERQFVSPRCRWVHCYASAAVSCLKPLLPLRWL